MKKATKILIVTGCLIALLVIALAVAPFLVNLNRFIPQIESLAKDAIGRQVKIKEIRLSLLSGVGAELKSLEIENQAGFSPKPFVTVDEIDVGVGILPLLRNAIVIEKIALIKPSILLEWSRSGELSLSDITKKLSASEKAEPAQPAEKKEPFEIAGRKLEILAFAIEDGALTFNDFQKPPGSNKIELNKFNLVVKNISQDKPMKVTMGFCLGAECTRETLSLKGTIGPLGEAMNFKNAAVELSAEISGLELKSLMPYVTASPPVDILGGAAEGSLSLKGNVANASGSAKIVLVDLSFTDLKHTWAPSPKTRVSLDSGLTIDAAKDNYGINPAVLTIGKSRMELNGEIKGSAYQFVIKQGQLELAELSQIVTPLGTALSDKGITISGPAAMTGKFGSASPLSFQTKIDMRDASLKWPGALNKSPGQKFLLNASGRMVESGYEVSRLSLEFPGGAAAGSANLSVNNELNLALAGNEISIEQLKTWVEALSGLPLKGKMNLAGALYGDLNQTDALGFRIDNLALKGPDMDLALQGNIDHFSKPRIRFNAQGGKINLDPLLDSGEKKPGSAQPAPATTAAGGPSTFETMDVEGKLKADLLTIKGFQIQNAQTNLAVKKGVVSLSDDSFDIFNGRINGPLSVDLAKKQPAFQANLVFSDLDLPTALKKFVSLAETMSGKIEGNLQFSGGGADWKQISSSLVGKGNFSLQSGSFKTLNLVGSLMGDWANSPQFRSMVQSKVSEKQWSNLNQTSFSLATGAFDLQNGAVSIKDLVMKVSEGQVKSAGKFDFNHLAKFEGEMLFDDKTSQDFASMLGLGPEVKNFLFKDGKNLLLPFTVKGDYPNLKVALNSEQYWKGAQKMMQDALKQQLQKEAGKQIQDLLNQLKR